MATIQFTVEGVAKHKREGRVTTSYEWGKRKGKPRIYQPADVQAWQNKISWRAKEVAPPEPWEGPISLTIWIFWKRPKGVSQKKRWRDKSPDVDRLLCPIMDAMNKIIYKDDGQVAYLNVRRLYVDEHPRIQVVVDRLDVKPFKLPGKSPIQAVYEKEGI